LRCPGPQEEISPFLLDSIYRAAIIYMNEYLLTGDQKFLKGLEEIRLVFKVINDRWKAAGKTPLYQKVVDF
jgi:hypothetical protein